MLKIHTGNTISNLTVRTARTAGRVPPLCRPHTWDILGIQRFPSQTGKYRTQTKRSSVPTSRIPLNVFIHHFPFNIHRRRPRAVVSSLTLSIFVPFVSFTWKTAGSWPPATRRDREVQPRCPRRPPRPPWSWRTGRGLRAAFLVLQCPSPAKLVRETWPRLFFNKINIFLDILFATLPVADLDFYPSLVHGVPKGVYKRKTWKKVHYEHPIFVLSKMSSRVPHFLCQYTLLTYNPPSHLDKPVF